MPGPHSAEDSHGVCEVCDGATTPWSLRHGGLLERCCRCGHLTRSIEDCPANHRSAAYGGDPAMDKARIVLTHRALTSGEKPSSVFEIGFGSGALLRRFLDAGAEIGGVEPDQLGVDVDPLVRSQGRFWTGGIEDVPDGAFAADLVVGIHVIEHVADPVQTLRKAASLLRPGGRLVMLTPAGDSWGPSLFGSAWWMLEDPTHVRFFTAESLERIAERAGLSDVVVDRMVADSLSVDVASAVRRFRPPGPEGALANGAVRLGALALAPAVVAARAVAPRTRATLRLAATLAPDHPGS